jgi:PST family polysaccharide transporter
VRKLAQQLIDSGLARNAAALYSVQFVRKLLPLIIIPYLARTLGPAGWGVVAFMQALAEFVVLGIEFGFNLSATREIARQRTSREACGNIMAGVLGAQGFLALLGILGALAVSSLVPLLHDNPKLVAAGLFYAVAQGFMPLWFFQGLERMRLAATLEICGRVAGLSAVFVFVRSPQDTWIALAIQGVAPALTTCAGLWMAYRSIRCCMPSYSLVRDALVRGWPMFVFRSAESLYGVANVFILGLFTGPAEVGYFASAEKISRAVFGLLNPIRESFYPRLSNLAHRSPKSAAQLARIGVVVMVSGGLLFSLAVYFFAPVLISLLMGQAFEPAVTVLRILSVLPLILSVTHSVGLQWLLPLGKEAEVYRIILSGGALNLAFALVLAPRFAHVGMACAVVSAEVFVSLGMVRAVLRSQSELQGPALAADLPLSVMGSVGEPAGTGEVTL